MQSEVVVGVREVSFAMNYKSKKTLALEFLPENSYLLRLDIISHENQQ